MQPPHHPSNNNQPGTYFIQHKKQEELDRLSIQDEMLTISMGGVLPEQTDTSLFHRVLDIGCGPGKWLIKAAKAYPQMSLLIGIDIDPQMIEAARADAEKQGVADRVEFHVMDALRMLEFANGFFDLTNMRLGSSFLRSWDWPKMINEMQRVTRCDGTIRIINTSAAHRSNSLAVTRFFEMFLCAFEHAGHVRKDDGEETLVSICKRGGCQQMQTKAYQVEFRAGTPAGQAFCKDTMFLMQNIYPFIQKWGCASEDYEEICRQAIADMQQSDFTATWSLLTVWSTVQRP